MKGKEGEGGGLGRGNWKVEIYVQYMITSFLSETVFRMIRDELFVYSC